MKSYSNRISRRLYESDGPTRYTSLENRKRELEFVIDDMETTVRELSSCIDNISSSSDRRGIFAAQKKAHEISAYAREVDNILKRLSW